MRCNFLPRIIVLDSRVNYAGYSCSMLCREATAGSLWGKKRCQKISSKLIFSGVIFKMAPQNHLSGPVLRDTARLSQRYPPRCNTPSPFSERFPCGEHAKWRCDTPPPKRGISAILAQYPMKTRQMGAIPPLRYHLERVLRDGGGWNPAQIQTWQY